jgi:hypothetical protein
MLMLLGNDQVIEKVLVRMEVYFRVILWMNFHIHAVKND